MSYEILLGGSEPLELWSVCTVCLAVERTATVTASKRWRCSDCGSAATSDSPLSVPAYLVENSTDTLETNLRQWSAVKGVRPAYKMMRSARYKCLLTLSRKAAEPR